MAGPSSCALCFIGISSPGICPYGFAGGLVCTSRKFFKRTPENDANFCSHGAEASNRPMDLHPSRRQPCKAAIRPTESALEWLPFLGIAWAQLIPYPPRNFHTCYKLSGLQPDRFSFHQRNFGFHFYLSAKGNLNLLPATKDSQPPSPKASPRLPHKLIAPK